MSKAIDLTGRRFSRLLVLHRDPKKDKWNNARWICKCDCGKTISVVSANIYRKQTTTSCGCYNKERCAALGRSHRKENSFRGLYRNYERNAHKRNLFFNIPPDIFGKLINGNCYYCGIEPKQILSSTITNGPITKTLAIYNGIDRLDNHIGYEIENCVSCCGTCNRAKHKKSQEEFKAWINRLMDFQNKKAIEEIV